MTVGTASIACQIIIELEIIPKHDQHCIMRSRGREGGREGGGREGGREYYGDREGEI